MTGHVLFFALDGFFGAVGMYTSVMFVCRTVRAWFLLWRYTRLMARAAHA